MGCKAKPKPKKSAGTGLAHLGDGEVCKPTDDKCDDGYEGTGDKKAEAAAGTKTCKAKPKPKKSAGTGLAQLGDGEVCKPTDDKCDDGYECTGDKKAKAKEICWNRPRSPRRWRSLQTNR